MSNFPLGLYLHIPWCHTRCIYCDFNTYIDGEEALKQRYHAALLREIREVGAALAHPSLDTIFFGGGTPTTLPAAWLNEIVETVRGTFALRPDAEITVEANPGTLNTEYLRELRAGGINRLSLGVQSFDDAELRFLSRLHDADTAWRAVGYAREAGFDNLSLDLIFNLPQQTLEQWQRNIQGAMALQPDHLSLYSLIVEPGTPLHRQVARGEVPEPSDDIAADMYSYTIDVLGAAGYAHYEISNWARTQGEPEWQTPRLAAAHNLIYWRNQPFLGLGAGAHGTLNGARWANVKRPQSYIERVETGEGLGLARDEKTVETIDRDAERIEQMMMGLRLIREGVSARGFEERFGVALAARYEEAIARGLGRGLLEWAKTPDDALLRLTYEGRFLANQAVVEFFE
ncbi:MAG: radical SAM family heme chaperone HemW [Ardenticatenales bacterium]|nr:radical SAM family heme chaperone HemW [Ardenticatenales bacterium]